MATDIKATDLSAAVRKALQDDADLRAAIESNSGFNSLFTALLTTFDKFAEAGEAYNRFEQFDLANFITAMRAVGTEFIEGAEKIRQCGLVMSSSNASQIQQAVEDAELLTEKPITGTVH